MEPFDIQWRASTKKDIRKLPRQEVARIIAAVEHLAREPFPHGAEKLSGSKHTYRIRVGDYRVGYDVLTEPKDGEGSACAAPEGCLSAVTDGLTQSLRWGPSGHFVKAIAEVASTSLSS